MLDWLFKKPEMSSKDLLDLVRDPEMTYRLQLAKERGELGVLSRKTRDIDPRTASIEELDSALCECSCWHATYPETDDYALVSWLEVVIADEITTRAVAKISGGLRHHV